MGFVIDNHDFAAFLVFRKGYSAADVGDNRKSFRFSGFKQFLDTRKTLRDVAAGNTAGVERTHSQLGTRFTDGLCRDDTDLSLIHI